MIRNTIKNCVRKVAWKYPSIYRLIGILRRGSDVNDLEYDVTVEGYPRSANTFMAQLLRLTQPHLKVRSHRHIPPHVAAAVQAGLPVLFLIRKPEDCISSYSILMHTKAKDQLFYYMAYHRALLSYRDRMFIADFASVTSDPKGVLQKFRDRFHLAINLDFDLTGAQEKVFREMDLKHTMECGGVNERSVNRPMESRAALKAPLVAEMNRPENRRYLDQANALYAEFLHKAESGQTIIAIPGHLKAVA
jgi:hypothetical protein